MSPLIVQSKLTESELKKVRQEVDLYKDRVFDAAVASSKYQGVNKDTRDARIYFPKISEAPNTFNILQSVIIQHYYTLPLVLTEISNVQYSIYGIGGRFRWHQDIIGRGLRKKSRNRGLTMSLNLTDPGLYEGGYLDLKTKNSVIRLDKTPGSYIIFPSFMMHRACDVISGHRESIVVWAQLTYDEIDFLEKISKEQGIF